MTASEQKPRTAETSEFLRYDFTPTEFMEHARILGRLNQELARSEERKKSVTAELAADVKRHQDEVSNQSQLVSNGYEYRDIKCEIQYHVPEKGKKTIIRIDTGEIVRVAFMTGQDMQEAFDFDQAALAAPAEGSTQDLRVAEPA